jgi:hypothetical protein
MLFAFVFLVILCRREHFYQINPAQAISFAAGVFTAL